MKGQPGRAASRQAVFTCSLTRSADVPFRSTVRALRAAPPPFNPALSSYQTGRMEVEAQASGNLGAPPSVGLVVGDMEAVEALMSMMTHSSTLSFRARHPRPLTPSSDCSEDDSATIGAVAMQEPLLVRAPL